MFYARISNNEFVLLLYNSICLTFQPYSFILNEHSYPISVMEQLVISELIGLIFRGVRVFSIVAPHLGQMTSPVTSCPFLTFNMPSALQSRSMHLYLYFVISCLSVWKQKMRLGGHKPQEGEALLD